MMDVHNSCSTRRRSPSKIRRRTSVCRSLPLHPCGDVSIDVASIVAISPTASGSRVFLADGDILHARLSPERLYGTICAGLDQVGSSQL